MESLSDFFEDARSAAKKTQSENERRQAEKTAAAAARAAKTKATLDSLQEKLHAEVGDVIEALGMLGPEGRKQISIRQTRDERWSSIGLHVAYEQPADAKRDFNEDYDYATPRAAFSISLHGGDDGARARLTDCTRTTYEGNYSSRRVHVEEAIADIAQLRDKLVPVLAAIMPERLAELHDIASTPRMQATGEHTMNNKDLSGFFSAAQKVAQDTAAAKAAAEKAKEEADALARAKAARLHETLNAKIGDIVSALENLPEKDGRRIKARRGSRIEGIPAITLTVRYEETKPKERIYDSYNDGDDAEPAFHVTMAHHNSGEITMSLTDHTQLEYSGNTYSRKIHVMRHIDDFDTLRDKLAPIVAAMIPDRLDEFVAAQKATAEIFATGFDTAQNITAPKLKIPGQQQADFSSNVREVTATQDAQQPAAPKSGFSKLVARIFG